MSASDNGTPDPRRVHYGQFYELEPLPDDGPLAVVWGNCQAESIRILLSASGALRGVRIPPVFELERDDLPYVERLMSRVDYLISQPVRDDYREMPLGTNQVQQLMPDGAQTALVTPFRYAGLQPWHVIVRVDGVGDPPSAAYHDLRTAWRASGRDPRELVATADGVRRVAQASIDELVRRENEHDSVPISDLIYPAGVDACHVINHPGNSVLVELARRTQVALGLDPDATDPGFVLLQEIYAPLEPPVIDAFSIDPALQRDSWMIHDEPVPAETIEQIHLEWYAEHPGLAETVVRERSDQLELLTGRRASR